jgi:hypothetical protein
MEIPLDGGYSAEMGRFGGDALVHTAHSWLVTALEEIISEVH